MPSPIAPVTLPDTERHTLVSRASGDSYVVDIALPSGEVPEGGWPAILLLDAPGCFATCVEALRRMARRGDATGVVPMVVIGRASCRERVFTAV